MFYLMEFCDGNIYWDTALKEIEDRDTRTAMYEQMAKALASIHRVDIEAAGLADYGRPRNYFVRQLGIWTKQYRASFTITLVA